jgi:hypothetical protein
MKSPFLLHGVALAVLPLALSAQSPQAPTAEQLAARAAIAQRPKTVAPPSAPAALVGPAIEAALDLEPGVATSVVQSGNASQIAVLGNLGIITPRAGNNFVLLSSGIAGTSAPEPGTGFGGSGAFGNDTASVTLTLNVPAGATTVSFDYRFFSAEYPDFVFAGFNDTFSARRNGTTIASVSVDSAAFFPAFTSIAGGTGFDIFTADPSGVDTQFGGGLPDAGLTDWLSGSADVVPGSTITLVFGIGDFGDDILDSAVLIDNLQFSNLEILDGDDDAFRQGNDLSNDPAVLADDGQARVGICADGTARLLLRMNLPAPGTVDFAIQGYLGATASGALGLPGGAPQGGALQVASVNTAAGNKAFAVYRAPVDFVRAGNPGDANARTRDIVLDVTFTPQGGGAPQQTTATLTIERPPVVLCHGLWSNPATWNGFAPLVGDGRFDFQRVDYSNNNGGLFAVNRFQTRANAVAARNAKKLRGIASAQVDWIGHSMGGVLPRSFAATGFFRRPDNFGAGDLHKLVTVNTPHWGSPMANLLLSIRNTTFVGDLLVVGMERLGMSVVGGAIDNLAEGSAAYAAIGATPVRTHCIAGIGGSQAIGVADLGLGAAAALVPPPYNALFRLLRLLSFATTAGIYRFQEHDLIVLRPSQEGGLGGGASTVLGGLGSTHTAVTSHAPAASQCIALLNAPQAGASFASPVPAPNLAPLLLAGGPQAPTPAPPGQGVQFTTASATVNPGQAVPVAVAPFGGFQPVSVLFLASSMTATEATTSPFSATFAVPADAIGTFSVIAIAENAQRQIAVSAPLVFPVAVSATLTGLELYSPRIYLQRIGQQLPVSVVGNFNDGVQRVLSGGALGTTYLSNDTSVAVVSADGIVTALREGVAAIVVQNGGFEVSLGAFVAFEVDVGSLGDPCPTSVGLPSIDTGSELPTIGNGAFGIGVRNAPPGSLVLISLASVPPDPIGLPLPGAPSCVRVHVLPADLVVANASAAGTVWHPLPIPNLTSLLGGALSAQAFLVDPVPAGLPLPFGSTPALDCAFGR